MKKLVTRTAFVLAFTAAGLSTAFAFGSHHDGQGMGHEMGMSHKMGHGSERDAAKMQERFTKHMADLKTKLSITTAQETAWNSFASAMQPPKDRPDMRKMHEEMAKLDTPARIDKMNAMHAERNAEMTKRGEATKALYNALTPAQRKIFDEQANKMMGGKHC